jgi:hypothetical protein
MSGATGRRRALRWLGGALVALLAVAGLAVVAFFVMLGVGLNQWGSNK